MILYIHEYWTGKFKTVRHVRVYEDYVNAFNQQKVLGGTIKVCDVIDEIY